MPLRWTNQGKPLDLDEYQQVSVSREFEVRPSDILQKINNNVLDRHDRLH